MGSVQFPPPGAVFPDYPQFSGFMAPCRFEGEINNLEVVGKIPKEIDGTFYRVMPDPQFPPFIENDPWFNGDGSISAFRIKDGHVDFKQRYVRTEKFEKERAAKRALLGRYRNKYTDAIEFLIRTSSNTNIVYFNGKLLACKEDGLPYAMDPETLETIGVCDFDGKLESLTFTAHPKFDPITREMVCFGYEAKGDGSPDVCFSSINSEGVITETVWLVAPIVAMIHDFAVTKNYVVFPLIPQICSVERLKTGGEHWQWDPNVPCYFGVLPRRGAKGSDVKWFKSPNSFPGHVANAYEDESGHIIVDLSLGDKNVFFWWADAEGKAPSPHEISSEFTRVTIDPKASTLDLPPSKKFSNVNMEFPRIDDRFATLKHRHCFFDAMDPSLGTNFPAISKVMGGGAPIYNSLGHFDVETGKYEAYFVGPMAFVQEPIFIPRSASAPEGDGYLMALVNRYDHMLSELVILDTKNFGTALATIKLPIRLRPGLHGNWVDSADVDGHPPLSK